jgi:hypothetical protein
MDDANSTVLGESLVSDDVSTLTPKFIHQTSEDIRSCMQVETEYEFINDYVEGYRSTCLVVEASAHLGVRWY